MIICLNCQAEYDSKLDLRIAKCPLCVQKGIDTKVDTSKEFFKKAKAGLKKVKVATTKQSKWTDEIKARVKELYLDHNNQEIADILNEEFDMNTGKNNVGNEIWQQGLKRKKVEAELEEESEPEKPVVIPREPFNNRKTENKERYETRDKKKNSGLPKEARDVIAKKYVSNNDQELRQIIADETGVYYPTDKIHNYRAKEGYLDPSDPDTPLNESEDIDGDEVEDDD